MKLLVARPKENKEFALAKLKVYKRGNVNLPKVFLETLGVNYKQGGEIIAEANPIKGEVILRKKPDIGKIPTVSLERFKRLEAYLLRGAQREAEKFFRELAKGLKEFHTDAAIEVGTLEDNTVYLKLGPRNIFEEIHLSYRETPLKPKGVITLEGGIPKRTESGYKITPQIKENVELLKQVIDRKVAENKGVELIEAPKFSISEAVQLGLIISKLLNRFYSCAKFI